MNRRRFLYSAAVGLFVPAAFGITPQQRRAVIGPRPVKSSALVEAVRENALGAGGGSNRDIGRDATIDSYSGAGSWTASSTYAISRVYCYLKKSATGSPASILSCHIYNDSSFTPGSLIATSSNTYTVPDLTTSFASYLFAFSGANSVTINSGSRYWFVGTSSAIDATYWFQLEYNAADTFTEKVYYYNGSSWAASDSACQVMITVWGYA